MAQHDYSIANQGFPATRADINNVLSAIATNNSGTSAPSTQFAGQFWIDTTSSTWTLYIHDGADDIQFATIDTSANTVNFIDSELGDNSVTTAKIADANVTSAKLSYPLTTFSSTGIDDNATSTAVTINSSQRIGIGTASPQTELHIVDSAGAVAGASYRSSAPLTLERTGGVELHMISDDSGYGQLRFGDASSTMQGSLQYDHSINGMLFYTSGSERMRIDSSGHIGMGTTTTTFALNIANGAGNMRIKTTDSANLANNATSIVEFHGTDNRGGYVGFVGGDMRIVTDTHSAGNIELWTNGSERMRINQNGNIQIGTTVESARLHIASGTFAGTDPLVVFSDASGTDCGSIDLNASGNTVAYTTSSDYRLKENVSYDFDATTRLKQLKPARFNFIADADTTVDGFIAHEVSSVVPEAISGEKDATKTKEKVVVNANGNVIAENIEQADWEAGKIADENGNTQYPIDSTWEATKVVPVYQGIDQSKLVPLLVKTIQELEARITALETNNP